MTEVPAGILDVDGRGRAHAPPRGSCSRRPATVIRRSSSSAACTRRSGRATSTCTCSGRAPSAEPSGPVEPGIELVDSSRSHRMVDAARSGRVRDAKTALALLMAAEPAAAVPGPDGALLGGVQYACAETDAGGVRASAGRAEDEEARGRGRRDPEGGQGQRVPRGGDARGGSRARAGRASRAGRDVRRRGLGDRGRALRRRRAPRSWPDADAVFAEAEHDREGEGAAARRSTNGSGPARCCSRTCTWRPTRRLTRFLAERNVTVAVAYETVQADDGQAAVARADVGDRRADGAPGGRGRPRATARRPGGADGRGVGRGPRQGGRCSGPAWRAPTPRRSPQAWRPRSPSSTATSTGSATSTVCGTGASRR